jgi:transposase-like protein
MYLRFTLSLRNVEELLAEWGIAVTDESIRCGVCCTDRAVGVREWLA